MKMKILIPIDESRFAQAALEAVARRSLGNDTEISVINVIPTILPSLGSWESVNHDAKEKVQALIRQEHALLVAQSVDYLKLHLPNCKIEGQVLEGNIRETILEAAKTWDADLIVMGSHGYTGFVKFVLGSIAEAVLHRAPCSVELVKLPELEPDRNVPVAPASQIGMHDTF